MKSTKTMVFVSAGLLVLSRLCLLPSVAGQGRERSLEQRVTVLEAEVAELTEKIDQIEGGSCSCTILNLQPLADFPENSSEGDLCIKKEIGEPPFTNILFLWCYLDGDWRCVGFY
jgi:hypothetical protein